MIEARLPREVLQALSGSAVDRPSRVETIAYGEGAAAPKPKAALTDPGNIVATPSDIEAVEILVRTVRTEAARLAVDMAGERQDAWRERVS